MNILAVEACAMPPVVQAIYLSGRYQAERYLAYADPMVCNS